MRKIEEFVRGERLLIFGEVFRRKTLRKKMKNKITEQQFNQNNGQDS